MSAQSVAPVPADSNKEYVEDNVVHLIPQFEGKDVESAELKFTGLTKLDGDPNVVVSVDDVIRLVITARVTAVGHQKDKNELLVRMQTAKVLTAKRVAFDPTDASDDGILRA